MAQHFTALLFWVLVFLLIFFLFLLLQSRCGLGRWIISSWWCLRQNCLLSSSQIDFVLLETMRWHRCCRGHHLACQSFITGDSWDAKNLRGQAEFTGIVVLKKMPYFCLLVSRRCFVRNSPANIEHLNNVFYKSLLDELHFNHCLLLCDAIHY